MNKFVKVIVLSVAALSICGCGAGPASKYYQLTVPADAISRGSAEPLPVTLLIGPINAPHLYLEDRVVYSTNGVEMGTYQYQRWAEPPTEMVRDVLLRELRASGRFAVVSLLKSSVRGDFVLRGRLYDFKEVSGNPHLARLTVEFELRDMKAGSTVWTHYYAHDEPVNGKDVAAVVTALDHNVQSSVKEVKSSLDEYFSSHPAK